MRKKCTRSRLHNTREKFHNVYRNNNKHLKKKASVPSRENLSIEINNEYDENKSYNKIEEKDSFYNKDK